MFERLIFDIEYTAVFKFENGSSSYVDKYDRGSTFRIFAGIGLNTRIEDARAIDHTTDFVKYSDEFLVGRGVFLYQNGKESCEIPLIMRIDFR